MMLHVGITAIGNIIIVILLLASFSSAGWMLHDAWKTRVMFPSLLVTGIGLSTMQVLVVIAMTVIIFMITHSR